MISLGRNITTPGDPLAKVPVEKIYHAILQPKEATASLIRQLRVVRSLNPKQYSQLKKQLPYLVCGMFNPAVRRIENFAYTEYFILDIDHISDKRLSLSDLKQAISQDARVVLCFASPSEDGLKVLFRLTERCHDAGVFTLFYKLFARQFSQQYGIEQVIDLKTSDVSRACFVSMDPQAYYNPDAKRVDLNSIVNTSDSANFFELQNDLRVESKQQKSSRPKLEQTQSPALTKPDVGDDVMANIRAILTPTARPQAEKVPAFVPQQLEDVMAELTQFITATGVDVTEIASIHYGKKIRTKAGMRMGETNVFYGRKGFSVVMSPRTGTHPEFNQAVADLIKTFFCIN